MIDTKTIREEISSHVGGRHLAQLHQALDEIDDLRGQLKRCKASAHAPTALLAEQLNKAQLELTAAKHRLDAFETETSQHAMRTLKSVATLQTAHKHMLRRDDEAATAEVRAANAEARALRAEADVKELEAHELAVALVVGIAHEPDTGPCAPGPRPRVLEEIREGVRAKGEAYELMNQRCDDCAGTGGMGGALDESGPAACHVCDGRGVVSVVEQRDRAQAEEKRLRALVADTQDRNGYLRSHGHDLCPWCGFNGSFIEHYHVAECPAFNALGELR